MSAGNHRNGVEAAGRGPLTVAIVLDKSGSMEPLREAVVDGYNAFLDDLRSEADEVSVSLTSFDTEINQMYVAEPLGSLPRLGVGEYMPGGMTALYDAIAQTTLMTDRRLGGEGQAEERVLLAVITDGQENPSSDYDSAALSRLVADYEERGNWTFVYLGAAHDSLEDARDAAVGLGLKRGNAMRWRPDQDSARASLEALASGVKAQRRRVGKSSDEFFADAGQSESDYLGETRTPGEKPKPRRRTAGGLDRRSLRDQLKRESS